MARLKKRRKGVSSKHRLVKRKQPGGNSSIIRKWDPRRTPRDNYNKLGIIGHVEKIEENVVEKAGGSDNGEETTTGVMFDSTGGDKWLDDGRLVSQEVRTRKKLLSDDEQQYAARLVAKHGCDFRSMMLDHEDANPNQLSQGKCKSLVKKFLALGKNTDMPVGLLVPE